MDRMGIVREGERCVDVDVFVGVLMCVEVSGGRGGAMGIWADAGLLSQNRGLTSISQSDVAMSLVVSAVTEKEGGIMLDVPPAGKSWKKDASW